VGGILPIFYDFLGNDVLIEIIKIEVIHNAKIRNTVERAFGVLKRRFFSLATGLRIRDMKLAAKLIICAMIVHNKCLAMGDFAEDFEDLQDPMALQHDWIADPNDDRTAGQQRRQSLLEALCGQ